jgi:hypothetical protein
VHLEALKVALAGRPPEQKHGGEARILISRRQPGGDVATARIPRDALKEALDEPAVTYVEASRPLTAE